MREGLGVMSEVPLYRCRANLEHIRQPRLDSDLDLRYFQHEHLENCSSCSEKMAKAVEQEDGASLDLGCKALGSKMAGLRL